MKDQIIHIGFVKSKAVCTNCDRPVAFEEIEEKFMKQDKACIRHKCKDCKQFMGITQDIKGDFVSYDFNEIPIDVNSTKFTSHFFDLIVALEELPQNRPLYKDSGLWQIRTDDMEYVLFQQSVEESFYDFIMRVYNAENPLQNDLL